MKANTVFYCHVWIKGEKKKHQRNNDASQTGKKNQLTWWNRQLLKVDIFSCFMSSDCTLVLLQWGRNKENLLPPFLYWHTKQLLQLIHIKLSSGDSSTQTQSPAEPPEPHGWRKVWSMGGWCASVYLGDTVVHSGLAVVSVSFGLAGHLLVLGSSLLQSLQRVFGGRSRGGSWEGRGDGETALTVAWDLQSAVIRDGVGRSSCRNANSCKWVGKAK